MGLTNTESIEVIKLKVDELKRELLEVRSSSLPAVAKAKRMGEVTLLLRAELQRLNIPWHKFMSEELDISPATLYNAQKIAISWEYVRHMNPGSLRETIRFIYPEHEMAEKLQRRFLTSENVNVVWASC